MVMTLLSRHRKHVSIKKLRALTLETIQQVSEENVVLTSFRNNSRKLTGTNDLRLEFNDYDPTRVF